MEEKIEENFEEKMKEIPVPSVTHQVPVQSATEILERETGLSPSQRLKSSTQVTEAEEEKPKKLRKWRRVRRKKHGTAPTEIGKIEGVMRITLSTWVQKVLHCLVGEDVTGEYPWKYVKKDDLEDNLELHEESSEFLPFQEEIIAFPREEMLMVYIPDEQREYDEFYICLTEAAEEGALNIINSILEEREERLNNSVLKSIGEWETLGSGPEVEDLQTDTMNRPLFEVEIESQYPLKATKIHFKLRLAEAARDGYAELLSTRQSFVNLERIRQDVGIQVTPSTSQCGSQTEYYYSNAYTQYEFEFPPLPELGKEFKENLKDFVDTKMGELDDLLFVNDHIDFYKNDYVDLVKDERFTVVPASMFFKPYASFFHPNTSQGKEIVCHNWHPMWSGTVAVAYAKYKSCDYRTYDKNEDIVYDAMYNTTPVLLWSLKDVLEPKLYLETGRAIACLSWCPFNENILVGGCANGQVVIWDITGKLDKVEEEEILTTEQRQYRIEMMKYMVWMKNTKDLGRVRPTVVSELEYSHKSPVTAIKWITVFREITKSGQIKTIPEEEERTSMQFMSCSLDGTLLAWDMLAKPAMNTSMHRPQRKSRRLKKRPSALTVAASPYRHLNRFLKPIFKVNVIAPNTTRLLPLTEFNIRVAQTDYVEKYPDPTRKFKMSDRIIYSPICRLPTYQCINQVAAGSVEGDFLIISWEGFDYNSGEVVNKENCKFDNMARYHDGPVVAVSRSELFPELILTVGGRIFAIWNKTFIGRPVMWRKNTTCRYTYGMWNVFRPATFRLTRADGFIEMWHLKTRSDRYTTIQFVSREGLGQVTTHPRTMKQNIMGMVGVKGHFELCYVCHDLTLATEEDKWSTYKLCERERNRKENFLKWQSEWLEKHDAEVKARQEEALIRQQEREEARRLERAQLRAQKEELKDMNEVVEKEDVPEPGRYAEWAQQKQLQRDKDRMIQAMLKHKQLDLDELRRNQIPLLKQEEENKQKQKNVEKRQNIAEQLFDESVAMLFPAAIEKKPPPPPDPYAGGDSNEIKMHHFEKYTKLSEEYDNYVKERQYYYHFNWLTLLQSGRERRKSLEIYHNRYSHKLRILREKWAKKNEAAVVNVTYQEPSHTSLGSIEYEIIPSETSVEGEGESNNVVPENADQ